MWGDGAGPGRALAAWALLGVTSSGTGSAREARGSSLGLVSHPGARWDCSAAVLKVQRAHSWKKTLWRAINSTLLHTQEMPQLQ